MAGSREPVFTNDEKVPRHTPHPMAGMQSTDDRQNYMLAEIIKSVSPSPSTLLNLVMQLGAHQPRWDDMPLPTGNIQINTENIDKRVFSHLQQVDQSMRVALRSKT